MKLRRAMTTVVAVAALGPVALLTASTAYANGALGSTQDVRADDGSGTARDASADAPAAATDEPTPEESGGTEPPATADPTATPGDPASSDTTAPPDDDTAPTDEPTGPATGHTPPPDDDGTLKPTPGETRGDGARPAGEWTPDQCEDLTLDNSLAVAVKGLPSAIVAGSGWHTFTFTVRNGSSSELRNVYVQTFTEYGDGINEDESLQLGLAQLQYKDPATGRWTDGYQDYYQDGPTLFRFSGTFIGSIPRLARGEQAVMELRVRIDREAPAGAAFALSSAVYAGRNNSCHTNGDTYDFRVLAVGSDPGRGDDAEPNGEKPAGPHDAPGKGTDPQGGAVGALPVGGSLASTGSSSVLPVLGLIGGVAVVAGTGAVLAVRRRRHETV